MWELFKARTGATAPLLQKIKLPGKQTCCHCLFPTLEKAALFVNLCQTFINYCAPVRSGGHYLALACGTPWRIWHIYISKTSAKLKNSLATKTKEKTQVQWFATQDYHVQIRLVSGFSSNWCLLMLSAAKERYQMKPVDTYMQVCVFFCLFEFMICSPGKR